MRRWKKWLIVAGIALVALGGASYVLFRSLLGDAPPSAPTAPPERSARRRPPRGRAQLRVTSRPVGAKILIDGRETGRLAPDIVALDARRPHTLRLELEGHEPYELELELEPGEARVVEVRLERFDDAP